MKPGNLTYTIIGLILLAISCRPEQEELYPELKVDMSLAGKASDSSFMQLYLDGKSVHAFQNFSSAKQGSDPAQNNYCASVFSGTYTRSDTVFEWSVSFITDMPDSMFMYLYALQKKHTFSVRTFEGTREVKTRGVEISYRARKPDSAKIYFSLSSSDTIQPPDAYFSLDGFSVNQLIPELTNVAGRFKCVFKQNRKVQGVFQGKFGF